MPRPSVRPDSPVRLLSPPRRLRNRRSIPGNGDGLGRLVSLYTDADRAKAAAIEAEAQKLAKALDAKSQKYLAEAVEKELAKFPPELRGKLRDALKKPEAKRSVEQKKLLAANPSANITPGVLYQYNQAAADDLKKDQAKVDAERARKPVEDFVSVLDEVPGVVPETRIFYRGDHRQPTQPVRPGDLTIASTPEGGFEIAPKDSKIPTSGRRLAMRSTSSTAAIRWSAAYWPTGSGCIISAAGWSTRPATSACWATGRPIPSSSTGWRMNSSVRAGASSGCTG